MVIAGWPPTPRLQTWLDKLLDILFPPHCAACRVEGSWFCSFCLSKIQIKLDTSCPQHVDQCFSLVPYANREIRTLITRLKYQSAWCLMPAIREVLKKANLELPRSTVTWAPASKRRLAERGVDHAELIARALAEAYGLGTPTVLLERTRHTHTNAQLEQPELRQGNVSNAFKAVGSIPASVLLIDDVKTSGATASACAKALKQAGAQHITLITLAYGG